MLKESAREIGTMAREVDRAQNERNILLTETMKYEGMVRFMNKERDMIQRAINDAKGVDPTLTGQDFDAANRRRETLEN